MLAVAEREKDMKGKAQRARRILASGVPSPMGHGPLAHLHLIASRAMKRIADQWRTEHQDAQL